ncbi:hypothetical protein HNR46_000896 [Haloferula luteola]|uniref:Restriction endonuclease n=1 Tax=Haloferula luteola TaxID=595692 RepID=A0A840V7F0_9BACT|nr:hypothetical protein [Haloferula luteola]MBB5350668.1 hypothetical protein [Haloferula luteola]
MRPDPKKQKKHINEIRTDIDRIIRFIESENYDDSSRIEIEALKMACAVYQGITESPLPVDYSNPKIRECCYYVAAAMDLSRYIKTIDDKRKLKKARHHLELIGSGGFGISATYQKQQYHNSVIYERLRAHIGNAPSFEVARDSARKSLELMIALAAMSKFDEVILENPNNSNKDPKNPDIIIVDEGIRFGIACKSISSQNPNNFKQRIREAIEQIKESIEDENVDPRKGVVFLDVSPLLNHDYLYMPEGIYSWNDGSGGEVLQQNIAEVMVKLLGEGDGHKLLSPLFADSGLIPCIIAYGHSVMMVEKDGGFFPHYYKAAYLIYGGDHSQIKSFTKRLNDALHCQ